MGAATTVYCLFASEDSDRHELLLVNRPEYANHDEGQYEQVQQAVDLEIERFQSENRCKLIGRMEDFPIGDDLYSDNPPAQVTLYYCHNTLNANYLVLGTAENKSEFLEEALLDYSDQVDTTSVYRVDVSVRRKLGDNSSGLVEPIELFSLVDHPNAKKFEGEPYTSRLQFEGSDTGFFVKGTQLDRQYRTRHYYLVFTNHDCPFEESCEITLVSRNLEFVARRSIGAPYSSYWLDSVEVVAADEYQLGFDDVFFRLSVNYPRKFLWRFFGWRALKVTELK